MLLKPIGPRSNYPFDPDNPVPNGMQLPPADLRAKYYKVINPEAKFFSGDARYQRDRRMEKDPRRTTKYKLMHADGQSVNEDTHRYLIEDIAKGRWLGKEHAHETAVKVDYEAMSKKPNYAHDHDMFSLVSNKYGREWNPDPGHPRTDFITKNAQLAKVGGTLAREKKTEARTVSFETIKNPSKTDLQAACNALVGAEAAPFMQHWLESQATNSDKISFMKAFHALSKTIEKKPSAHQKAIQHAQTIRKMIKAGIPASRAADLLDVHQHPDGAARSQSAMEMSYQQGNNWKEAASDRAEGRSTENIDPQQRPVTADASTSRIPNVVGTFRPSTAYINTLPMPPMEDEVPPPERRRAGVYPFDWKPRPRVQYLKDKLQEILQRKHKELKVSFRRFDEDHHGTVDLSELYRVMVVESGIQCTRSELEEVWDLFDRDRDGVIKYADYSKTMGYDALDERDYFQIAQRKAAGRYNEEVKFCMSKDDEAAANMKRTDDPNDAVNLNLKRAYAKEELGFDAHANLFSLPEKKMGSLFNEKFKKNQHTVPNTAAHSLRIELAAKLEEKFDSIETAFEYYSEGRRSMSEKYFSDMIHDLGLGHHKDVTIAELFAVYDRDLDGHLDVDNFCDSFILERQGTKKPDVFFQDVVLTDVPKVVGRKPPKPKVNYLKDFEQMLLPQHAKKQEPIGKLIPARTRSLGERGGAKRRSDGAGREWRDLPVSSMMPPRPMTALSQSGGFDYSSAGQNLQQRAATPLQQLHALQNSSEDVRKYMQDLPPRAVSTPPVPGPRAVMYDQAPGAYGAADDMRKRPKSSVPNGVATDFEIRPHTARQADLNKAQTRKNRPHSAAELLAIQPSTIRADAKGNEFGVGKVAARAASMSRKDVVEVVPATGAATGLFAHNQIREAMMRPAPMRPMSASADDFFSAPSDHKTRPKSSVFKQETCGPPQW